MRKLIGPIAITTLLALGLATAACSGADTGKSSNDICSKGSCSDKGDDKSSSATTATPVQPAAPATTATTPAGPILPDAGKSPTPTGTSCTQLAAANCCSKLESVASAACTSALLFNNDTGCRTALAACGISILQNNDCSKLNTCCNQLNANGYDTDASQCVSYVNAANAGNCKTQHGFYSDYGECDP